MKFEDFTYERPDFETVKDQLEGLFVNIEKASSAREQMSLISKVNHIRGHVQTMSTLAEIRHSINTQDEFYEEENDYWNEHGPLYEELNWNFYHLLIHSKFRDALEGFLTKQFFKLAEFSLKSFSPEIIGDLQEENRLASAYDKLLASAEIPFAGELLTLPGIGKYTVDKERVVRREAVRRKFSFFQEHEAEIDEIFDQLVKIRHRIAQALGFKNFVELGYIRMNRTDYTPEMVEIFRQQVKDELVPLANKLYEEQRKRLGLARLQFYDVDVEYRDGNAAPKGDPQWILAQGKKMYCQMSRETKAFFLTMVDQNLLDLANKPGKRGGGYCTYLNDYKVPFIFSNFNGTSGDVDVLTHEAGHAFQVYSSRHIELPELNFPTSESAEIHSMSMEFFAWPWMEQFFKEEAGKYKYTHLSGAVKFIPYGVLVDEFQHHVYEKPEWTPAQRKAAWRHLEREYLPHKDYSENSFLDRGTWWYQQGHIFSSPFYYIDYTLAQICALQFWKRMGEDRFSAWSDYLKICQLGGTKPFVELVKRANLVSPFEDGCIRSVLADIEQWLSANQPQ